MRQPDDYTEEDVMNFQYQQEIEKLKIKIKELETMINEGIGFEDLHPESMDEHMPKCI